MYTTWRKPRRRRAEKNLRAIDILMFTCPRVPMCLSLPFLPWSSSPPLAPSPALVLRPPCSQPAAPPPPPSCVSEAEAVTQYRSPKVAKSSLRSLRFLAAASCTALMPSFHSGRSVRCRGWGASAPTGAGCHRLASERSGSCTLYWGIAITRRVHFRMELQEKFNCLGAISLDSQPNYGGWLVPHGEIWIRPGVED